MKMIKKFAKIILLIYIRANEIEDLEKDIQ